MFIKVNKSKNYFYLQLIKSVREGKNVKHEVIGNLGRYDLLIGNKQIADLGKKLLSLSGQTVSSIFDMKENNRLCYGDVVYKKIWDKFKISEMFEEFLQKRRIKFNVVEVIYLMVIDRLLSPRSKLASYENQFKYINIEEVKLEDLYKGLDFLSSLKEKIEEKLFEQHKNLFNMKVDVVFYDVTTFHFESQNADSLREFGYSKDGKYNEVQVVLGLLIDTEGRPIGYDLFPGNTFDGKTLKKSLEKIKERFSIRRLILVADKGINSAENLHLIKESGYDYIVSSKIKNSSKEFKEKIFTKDGYNVILLSDDEDEKKEKKIKFKYKVIDNHKVTYRDSEGNQNELEDRLIITWTEKRAKRDRKNRERQIRKVEERIKKNKRPDNKKGANRYISTEGELQIKGINQKQIEMDSQWDGYYGIQTSENQLVPQSIVENYHGLWKIEESFRVMKSTMKTRPVFHWTERRIKGHFVMCFLSFLIERNLEYRLKINKIEASPERIKSALNSLELSEVEIKGTKYLLKGKAEALGSKILRLYKIKPHRNLILRDEYSK